MKQLTVCVVITILISCNNPNSQSNEQITPHTSATNSTATEKLDYPYQAGYSSDFEIGNPQHAQMVLNLWKDWDNNTFEKGLSSFADSVTMEFSDGTKISTTRDSIMVMAKGKRAEFTSVTSSVDAWIALRSKDKNEDWVCVWGKEVDTYKDGRKDSVYLQENWMINKEGKVAYMSQFMAKPPKK